tara:strand:+ start:24732 stop:25562 length:831 start_codon:yes stop_codon:yes gene_type:complete
MDIIGLGEAGCNLADCFAKYPQYKTYKIDVGLEGEGCFSVEKQRGPEDYESNAPNLKTFFSPLEEEVTLIVGGAGYISAMSLAILEQIKDKSVSVLYICPNHKSLTGKKKMLEQATFGILQQYARSGLIKNIILVSNEKVAAIVGNLPVIGYYDKINDLIVSTFHFINVFNHSKHVYGMVEEREEVCSISTIGLLDTETSEEKRFYDLDLVREKSYFYALRNESLLNESNMIATLEGQVEEKKKEWLTKISYRLYSTEYENNFGFCINRTSKVQGE